MSQKRSHHRINLIPGASRPGSLEVPAQALPLALVATLLVLGAAGMSQQKNLKRLQAERDQIAARQEEVTRRIEQLNAQKNQQKNQLDQLSTLQQIQARKVSWAELFKELSLMTARETWLTSLKAKANNGKRSLVLEGSAESPIAVSSFFEALEVSYFFKRVMLVNSTLQERTYPPLYKYKFDIPVDQDRDAVATSAAAPTGAAPAPQGAQK